MVHSFLLIGQSNMAGRGVIGSVAPIENPRLYVSRNARWQPMFVPVNPDRPFSGISLAESFADAYSRDHDVDVGLIPCADGGTSLAQWAPGGLLYDHALMQARLARRTSVLRGILWHQGESDCSQEASAVYAEKLCELIRRLRRDLEMPEIPVVLGALGDFLKEYDEGTRRYYPVINAALRQVAETQAATAFAPADGLSAKPDHLHFDAKSLREFGLRYYAAYRTVERPVSYEVPCFPDDGRNHTLMEQL